jgi:hypothetical protein
METTIVNVKANLSNRSVLYIVTDISVTSLLDRSNPEVTLITITYISLVIQEYCNIKLIGTPRNWP